ncbi:MAG: hypothetical protein ACK2T2_11430 [Anaerolineales bacterium]
MRRILILCMVLLVTGCGFQSPNDLITPAADPEARYRGLQLENLGVYQAHLTMSFDGASDWWYQVLLASDGEKKSFDLSIEGLDADRDPGDVRIIEQDGVYTLQGEATEGACWQFPAGEDYVVDTLSPDDILPPDRISSALANAGSDTFLGRSVYHLSLVLNLEPDFTHAEVDIWREKRSGSVLRYEFQLDGEDPLFNAGKGTLFGDFSVLELGSVTIEPLSGCGTNLPLPNDARAVYLLSDLVRYTTNLTPDQVAEFLLQTLPQQGWEPAEDSESIPGTAALSFQRGETALEVFIQAMDDGTEVRMFQASINEP